MPYDVVFNGTLVGGATVSRKLKRFARRRDAVADSHDWMRIAGKHSDGLAWQADTFCLNCAAFACWSFDVVKAPLLLRGKIGGAQ